MLGKRKREIAVVSRGAEKAGSASPPPVTIDDAQELLRRHFESRFEPLDLPLSTGRSASQSPSESSESGEDNSDWDGLSDGSEDSGPEVVEHADSFKPSKEVMDKLVRKEFMTAKPPSSTEVSNKAKPKTQGKDDSSGDEGADAANLKNDLALQRLLKESHLLDSASELNPTGKNRHRALDIRMQSIGSKTSLYSQKKMPMSHRKGIEGKAAYKEEVRRREARENGIILEKPSKKKDNKSNVRRERGIGGPAIGKFAGGTLRLSQRDVMAVQGPKRTGSKGRGGKRGRK